MRGWLRAAPGSSVAIVLAVLGGLVLLLILAGCDARGGNAAKPAPSGGSPTVEPGGGRVTLAADQAARFPVAVVATRNFQVNLTAPARAVASVVGSANLTAPLLLFETQDISQLFSDFTRNRAAFQRAEVQRRRLGELASRDAVAGKDVLDAETDLRQSEASLRDAEAKLRQIGLDPAQLVAMPAGMVYMVADVPEAKIGAVDLGERAWFDFNAYPGETLTGRVKRIADAVDPQTRSVRVGIELSGYGGRIKPGMFARVAIEERTERAVLIPLSAVLSVEGHTFVFVRTSPLSFERREVVLGLDNGKDVEVRSGLANGESVVAGNVILLKGLSFGY